MKQYIIIVVILTFLKVPICLQEDSVYVDSDSIAIPVVSQVGDSVYTVDALFNLKTTLFNIEGAKGKQLDTLQQELGDNHSLDSTQKTNEAKIEEVIIPPINQQFPIYGFKKKNVQKKAVTHNSKLLLRIDDTIKMVKDLYDSILLLQIVNEASHKVISEKIDLHTNFTGKHYEQFSDYKLLVQKQNIQASIAFLIILILLIIWLFFLTAKLKREKTITPSFTTSLNEEAVLNQKIMNFQPKRLDVSRNTHENWLVVGGSVKGKSHLDNNIACQDNNTYKNLGDGWGIVVVSDGAGSAKNSDKGSYFTSAESVQLFSKLIHQKGWQKDNRLPVTKEWSNLSNSTLYKVRYNLEQYAKKEGLVSSSLACTVILIIYSPLGLLTAHIGDGRAAYLDIYGQWKSAISPYKGEEANSTIFLTSNIWHSDNINNYIKTSVISEPLLGITLLSDGCESLSFECNVFNKATGKWHDPNRPYQKFFNEVRNTLIRLHIQGYSQHQIEEKWKSFLESGSAAIRNEPDDKTMILGVLV